MKNIFTSVFLGKTLVSENRILLANDLFLIHQAFYNLLGVYTAKFESPVHKQILLDELGLSERGRTEKYGILSHGELWLKDLEVELHEISLQNNEHIIPFQRACYEAALDKEKGEAFIAAVEGVAFQYVEALGEALKFSGFKELLCVDVHCNPKTGLEVEHEAETDRFSGSPSFEAYREIVIKTFISLSRHFRD